jgi:prepilin-type N-terminal cleavage/methylation domain-containing protein
VRRGFTLIEAIVALVILAGAMVAVVQVRAQIVLGTERQREVQREDRAVEALFQMLVNGVLSDPAVDPTGARVWSGEYLGRPYRVTRRAMPVDNPVAGGVAYAVSPRITVYRYAIEYAGRESEMVWHR